MSLKSFVNWNFPKAERRTVHEPTVVTIVRSSSFWCVLLEVERRDWLRSEQPRSVSSTTTPVTRDGTGRASGEGAGGAGRGARTTTFGLGTRGIVSIVTAAGSATRGATAASGTTTAIAAIHAGTADFGDSVSRRRRASSTSISRVASCAGRAIATL